MRAKVFGPLTAALLVWGLITPWAATASAQAPVLEPGQLTFSHADGSSGGGFSDGAGFGFGEEIHLDLGLTNTGDAPATGVSATLEFSAGTILDGTQTWPDIAPGATETNLAPFRFTFGEPSDANANDHGCWVFFDGFEGVDPDEGSTSPGDVTAVPVQDPNPSDDYVPSDQYGPIGPGTLTLHVTSDDGSLDVSRTWGAVCALAAGGIPVPRVPAAHADTQVLAKRLAMTGSQPGIAVAGLAFLGLGLLLRRRALA